LRILTIKEIETMNANLLESGPGKYLALEMLGTGATLTEAIAAQQAIVACYEAAQCEGYEGDVSDYELTEYDWLAVLAAVKEHKDTTFRATGRRAIEIVAETGGDLYTHESPTSADGPVSMDLAREIVREDPSLIYCDVYRRDRYQGLCTVLSDLDEGDGTLGEIIGHEMDEDPTVTSQEIRSSIREMERERIESLDDEALACLRESTEYAAKGVALGRATLDAATHRMVVAEERRRVGLAMGEGSES
jgi:hypothetical protein